MAGHHIWILTLAGALVSASATAASSAKAPSFDGSWTLVAQTTDGHCGSSSFEITIRKGRVHYPGGVLMGFPASLAGTVAPSGRTRLNLVAGPRAASGTGTFGGAQGSGQWAGTGPSGTCSGVWTATRVQAQTASGDAGPAPQYPVPFWMVPQAQPAATPAR
jgi:hypothetical protein